MLILPKKLTRTSSSDFAWQNSSGKRTPDDYDVVPDPMSGDPRSMQVVMWVADAVYAIAPPSETGVPVHQFVRVLFDWCRVTPAEREAWEKKGSSNAPIFSKSVWKERARLGRAAEVRIYDNAVDLVLAILGHIRSRAALRREELLAMRTLKSSKVQALVQSACAKVITAITAPTDEMVAGAYLQLHGFQKYSTWAAQCGKLETATNIQVLHDISCYFDDQLKWVSAWTKDAKGSRFKEIGFLNKSSMRQNVGSVNEDTPWAERARFSDRPTWAGPSGTTETLCRFLVEIAKVEHDELLACVYGLFALWASDRYPKTATPIHHLFGVMSGALDYLPKRYRIAADASLVDMHLEMFLGGPLAKL